MFFGFNRASHFYIKSLYCWEQCASLCSHYPCLKENHPEMWRPAWCPKTQISRVQGKYPDSGRPPFLPSPSLSFMWCHKQGERWAELQHSTYSQIELWMVPSFLPAQLWWQPCERGSFWWAWVTFLLVWFGGGRLFWHKTRCLEEIEAHGSLFSSTQKTRATISPGPPKGTWWNCAGSGW